MSQKFDEPSPHIPVMVEEVSHYFAKGKFKTFFEGTIGSGAHAKRLLKEHPEIEHYFACDKDPEAIEIAKKALSPWKDKIEWIQGNFADLDFYLKKRGVDQVDGFFLIWGYRLCN